MAQNCNGHQEEVRERILRRAMDLFFANGIKSVKMDDIAADLQMSKRTLYEMFEDKENLLLASIRYNHEQNKRRIAVIASQADNPLEVFAGVFNMKMDEVRRVSAQFITDCKRYDSITKGFEEESKTRKEDTLRFVNSCVEQGLFREGVDYVLITRMFDLVSRTMIENEIYKEYSMDRIVFTMYDTFFRGICTPKGLEILDKKINKKQ